MEISIIGLFVQLKTTEPIKLINHETKIYETYTPNKIESKLIRRLITKSEKTVKISRKPLL